MVLQEETQSPTVALLLPSLAGGGTTLEGRVPSGAALGRLY